MFPEEKVRRAELRAAVKEKEVPDWLLLDVFEPHHISGRPTPEEASQALDEQALSLHARGKSYRQIGERLGMPKSSAYKRARRALRRQREEFQEHEADLRDECIFALKQGIGQIMALSARGDKTAYKLVLQYVNTRQRLAKILDPTERAGNLDAEIEQEERAWRQQQAAARQAWHRQCDLSLQKEREKAAGRSEKAAGAAQNSPVAGGAEEAEAGCGRNRGRTCGRSEQPLAATEVALSDVFDVNGPEEGVEVGGELEGGGAVVDAVQTEPFEPTRASGAMSVVKPLLMWMVLISAALVGARIGIAGHGEGVSLVGVSRELRSLVAQPVPSTRRGGWHTDEQAKIGAGWWCEPCTSSAGLRPAARHGEWHTDEQAKIGAGW